jgi:carbamoylphosphate synthase large subunit
MTRWLGPYIIEKCYDNGSMHIRTIDEERIPLLVNGFRLNTYNKPLTKEELTTIVRKKNMDVIDRKNALNPSQ